MMPLLLQLIYIATGNILQMPPGSDPTKSPKSTHNNLLIRGKGDISSRQSQTQNHFPKDAVTPLDLAHSHIIPRKEEGTNHMGPKTQKTSKRT